MGDAQGSSLVCFKPRGCLDGGCRGVALILEFLWSSWEQECTGEAKVGSSQGLCHHRFVLPLDQMPCPVARVIH